jgi:hypothetical protein
LHGDASGSGGPSGNRNGQNRHGERTKAAIAERQKFSALIAKPTGSKLVKGPVESGEICSMEVVKNSEENSENKRCYANTSYDPAQGCC